MSPLKRFYLTCIKDLQKHRLLSNLRELKHLKKLFFKKHASSFQKGFFNKFRRCIKTRCSAGVLFLARFTTWEENLLPHKFWFFFIRNLPSVLGFKPVSPHIRKKPENVKTFVPTFQIQFRQSRWLILS